MLNFSSCIKNADVPLLYVYAVSSTLSTMAFSKESNQIPSVALWRHLYWNCIRWIILILNESFWLDSSLASTVWICMWFIPIYSNPISNRLSYEFTKNVKMSFEMYEESNLYESHISMMYYIRSISTETHRRNKKNFYFHVEMNELFCIHMAVWQIFR